jgi:DNA repair protein RadC
MSNQIAFPEIEQIVLTGFDPEQSKVINHKRKCLDQTFAKLRQLHDELNAQLYAHPSQRPIIHSPTEVITLLDPFIGSLDHEEMWVIDLDTRNRVMNLIALYKGSVNMAQVRVGEVFRQAITDNALSIIVAHNHPSGDPSPSPEDVALTRAMVQAGKLLDIDVLDHLIVARGQYVSLKERGLGFS